MLKQRCILPLVCSLCNRLGSKIDWNGLIFMFACGTIESIEKSSFNKIYVLWGDK